MRTVESQWTSLGPWGTSAALVAAVAFGAWVVSTGGDERVKRAIPAPAMDVAFDSAAADSAALDTLVVSAGTFWGTQAVYLHVNGVVEAATGYTGGTWATANYDSVGLGRTRHAHSVQVVYDPAVVSLGELLRVFFNVAHDPTSLNKQGPDRGPQYRSAIWYRNDAQRRVAQAYIAQLDSAQVFRKPIVTELNPLGRFYAAERWHQDWVAKNPGHTYTHINDLPKLADLERLYPEMWREVAPPWTPRPLTEDTSVIEL